MVWVTLWLIGGQNIRELGCCNINLNMWPKFLRLKMKCIPQDEAKSLRLHVKIGWMRIQKHCVNLMKFNEVMIEEMWREATQTS
jgi:hypothetical protein